MTLRLASRGRVNVQPQQDQAPCDCDKELSL